MKTIKSIKAFRNRCKIKSLYIKWILMFTGIIVFAHMCTLLLVVRFLVTDTISSLDTKLYRKAEFLQSLTEQGIELTEDIMDRIGDTDIRLRILDEDNIPDDIGYYTHIISYDMLRRTADGEIVSSYTQEVMYKLPFCLVAVDGRILLLTPYLRANEVTSFVMGMQRSMLLSAVIASFFIVFIVIIVIRPIKKVTAAAREVAKGNFNVKLETKSVDEVGQLIINFNLMTEELKKNEYLKKDFVSSVSHEFKTPITSIEGFAKLLKKKDLTQAQVNEYTDIIIRETTRLSNLSSNLLQLSILDGSGFEPPKTKFYLDEQIRSVILLLENQWVDKEIELDIELEEVLFFGNEELLSHVWINIIQNAIKFSPFGRMVKISLVENDGAAVVTVTNDGPGIQPEHAGKIFDRFYKADRARSKEGNGLGLSIAKRIVEISKGSISFESQQGRGTEFKVVLPNKKQ